MGFSAKIVAYLLTECPDMVLLGSLMTLWHLLGTHGSTRMGAQVC